MNEQLTNILKELELGVGLSVRKYKETNDMKYINQAADSLNEVLDMTHGNSALDIGLQELRASVKGMLAGIEHIIKTTTPKESENEQDKTNME